jgi:hypothetical protein
MGVAPETLQQLLEYGNVIAPEWPEAPHCAKCRPSAEQADDAEARAEQAPWCKPRIVQRVESQAGGEVRRRRGAGPPDGHGADCMGSADSPFFDATRGRRASSPANQFCAIAV